MSLLRTRKAGKKGDEDARRDCRQAAITASLFTLEERFDKTGEHNRAPKRYDSGAYYKIKFWTQLRITTVEVCDGK